MTAKQPYYGPWGKRGTISPLPAARRRYSGRNENGGLKCHFTTSADYLPWPRKQDWKPDSYRTYNKVHAPLLPSGIRSVTTEWGS